VLVAQPLCKVAMRFGSVHGTWADGALIRDRVGLRPRHDVQNDELSPSFSVFREREVSLQGDAITADVSASGNVL